MLPNINYDSDGGFIKGSEEKNDTYNIGLDRKHTANNTYLEMKIIEIFDDHITLKGCQRTWAKYTVVNTI